MPGLFEIGLGILLPALLCFFLLAIARTRGAAARATLSGIAFAAPWSIAFCAFFRRLPTWPSAGKSPAASDWLAWLVLLAAIAALLYLASFPPRILAASLRFAFATALVLLTLARWAGRTDSWATLAVAFAALAIVWILADAWIASAEGPRAPIALAVAATSISLASLLGRSALLGALAGTLAACLAAAALLAMLRPRFRLPPSATLVVFLVLGGVLIQGCVFSRLPRKSALLAAASLLAPGVLSLRRPQAAESWRRTLLAGALALVPGALAVWTAWTPSDDDLY